MNISYDYYRIFYYVAKCGSFTRAAAILLNNQPNMTRAIKALEGELGCTLFLRTNKGVTLTSEGETLYAHVSIAFEQIQTGELEITAGRSLQCGSVAIGATEISLRCFLLPILNDYRSRYPGIRIKISNSSTPQALSDVKNGLVDFAVVTTPIEALPHLHAQRVTSFTEIAVCGEALRNRLCHKKIGLSDLCEYPLVSLERGRSSYSFYKDLFAKHGITFAPDVEVSTADQILPIVKHNLGIGFVPDQFLLDEPSGIYPIRLQETIPQRDICLITRKGHTPSPAAKALEEMLIR